MQHPIEQNDPKRFSSEKENQYFDRKSARKDANDISRHISAFANASGGKLVIGIEDDGEITGFRRRGAHDIEDFLQAPITCCDPVPAVRAEEVDVTNSSGESDRILVLDVQASTDRVIARKRDGEVFLRQKDESVRLDREQVRALEYDKNQRRFEDELADRFGIDDVDRDVMDRYREELGTDAPCEQILRSRGMLVDGHLTNAGVLLFARNPTQFIPCARVRVMRFDGSRMETGRRLNIVKDRTFDGPLPKVIEGAKQMISSQLREFQFLGDDGKFKIIPEYPEFAWFEGLVNAVTHRNYAYSGDYIRVMMYDDRLEILSPGKLPNIVTLENMRHTRWSRNPIIARTLVEFGWVRELNEGGAENLRRDGQLLPQRPRLLGAERLLGAAHAREQHNVARPQAERHRLRHRRRRRVQGPHRARAVSGPDRVCKGQGHRQAAVRAPRKERQVRQVDPEGPRRQRHPLMARLRPQRPVPALLLPSFPLGTTRHPAGPSRFRDHTGTGKSR